MSDDTREMFIRPVIAGLEFTVLGELFLQVIHGFILFPDSDMLYEALCRGCMEAIARLMA